MAEIPELAYADATPAQQQAHDAELQLRGRMTNMKRTLLHSPAALRVYGEWFTLRDELLPAVPARAIWIFAHAISVANDNQVGETFMRRALIEAGDDPDNLALSADEHLIQRFGAALGSDPRRVPAEIWSHLRARYPSKTLVDLVAFAGIMVATNLFTAAVGTELDPELAAYRAPTEG